MKQSLQRFSVAVWAAARRVLDWLGDKVHGTPWLRDWVYAPEPERTREEEYRDFNGWYFGLLEQQERMLADQPRMDFYHTLIGRQIRPGDRVIDLGTGTGVLAAWASAVGASQVWAIDHSIILDTAQKVADANGITNVEFVHIHSTDFKLPEKVDVILHEQIGDYLFDENMVANVCDLRDRLLKPGGRVLPSRFKWYCEPVMLRDSRRVPFAWEMNAHGYDYACLREDRPNQPEYLRVASCDDNVVYRFLGPPEPTMEVDLMTIPGDAGLPRRVSIEREITQSGRLDGLVVFFEVEGDSDLTLTSSPLDEGRAPHWGFRILRTDTEELSAGDRVMIEMEVGRWADPDSWEWTVKVSQPDEMSEADLSEEPRLPA